MPLPNKPETILDSVTRVEKRWKNIQQVRDAVLHDSGAENEHAGF
jgi:hypothetical protein